MNLAGVAQAKSSRSVMDKTPNIQKGIYLHFKGGKYEVLDVVRHSETLETMVLYRHLPVDGELWVRPLAMFMETIERDGNSTPRFQFIGDATQS